MKQFNGHTREGRRIIDMGDSCIYNSLSDLYQHYSISKQQAFDECYEQYLSDPDSFSFGVGNANTNSFTASWFTYIDGELVMRVETYRNSYLVWLDR